MHGHLNVKFILGNDLCVHCNMVRNLFQFLPPPPHPSTCGMHEEIFLQRAIGVTTRNWYIALLRLFFWTDFHTIFLFSYCCCLIFGGLLTTLRLLDCIVSFSCWMVCQLFEICLPNLQNWVCIKYFLCYPLYKIQGVLGMRFHCYSLAIHSVTAV